MLHNPEVLILDEPTSGLDMNQLADIRALIPRAGQRKNGSTMTHIMPMPALCDRVIIVDEGKLVADDPIGELQNRIKGEHLITVKFLNTSFQLSELKSINGVERAEAKEGEVKIYADAGTDVRPDIFQTLCCKGLGHH